MGMNAVHLPPAEVNMLFALLDVISKPDAARETLEKLVAAKQAAGEHHQAADRSLAKGKQHHEDATAKLAEARKLEDTHKTRVRALDERHNLLLDKDKRLTDFEAQVAAREKEVIKTLGEREKAVKVREADVTKREAALRTLEAEAQALKETYQRKVDTFRSMHAELTK